MSEAENERPGPSVRGIATVGSVAIAAVFGVTAWMVWDQSRAAGAVAAGIAAIGGTAFACLAVDHVQRAGWMGAVGASLRPAWALCTIQNLALLFGSIAIFVTVIAFFSFVSTAQGDPTRDTIAAITGFSFVFGSGCLLAYFLTRETDRALDEARQVEEFNRSVASGDASAPPPPGGIICHNVHCGYRGMPAKQARGSAAALVILLIVFFPIGLIYAALMSGHHSVCPRCRMRIS